jgi:hypothetical protein
VHRAGAVNSQPLDRVVAAVAVNKPPQDKAPAGEAVAVKQEAAVAAVVAALKQEAAVAAVAAALRLTLPRQAPETFARFFLIGAGIWECCAAIRNSI